MTQAVQTTKNKALPSAYVSVAAGTLQGHRFQTAIKQSVLIWQHMLTTGKRDQTDSFTLKISDLTKLPYTDKLQQFLICYNIDSNQTTTKQ